MAFVDFMTLLLLPAYEKERHMMQRILWLDVIYTVAQERGKEKEKRKRCGSCSVTRMPKLLVFLEFLVLLGSRLLLIQHPPPHGKFHGHSLLVFHSL